MSLPGLRLGVVDTLASEDITPLLYRRCGCGADRLRGRLRLYSWQLLLPTTRWCDGPIDLTTADGLAEDPAAPGFRWMFGRLLGFWNRNSSSILGEALDRRVWVSRPHIPWWRRVRSLVEAGNWAGTAAAGNGDRVLSLSLSQHDLADGGGIPRITEAGLEIFALGAGAEVEHARGLLVVQLTRETDEVEPLRELISCDQRHARTTCHRSAVGRVVLASRPLDVVGQVWKGTGRAALSGRRRLLLLLLHA